MEHPRDLVIAGLPPLERSDLPSFVWDGSKFPEFLDAHLRQFSNDDADWVFCNTVYQLEQEAVDWLSKKWTVNFRTIGPTIPSMYLNNQISYDNDYGISIFNPDTQICMNWLHSKPYMSVVYVSFGSLARLSPQQMEELCFGLNNSNHYFLWVVRDSEISKLHATNFSNGVIVSWCPQLQVLASGKVGCFITHCGWNSTLEALSLGVPMVAMPQCGDQFTNAKFIQDVWGTGVRAEEADDEKGMVIIKREEIERCIREVMEGEEMRRNAGKWEKIVMEAVLEGGTSDKNTEDFAAALIRFAQT
ncbi:UDP-glycosyltransferase 74D1 [Linum perenne]